MKRLASLIPILLHAFTCLAQQHTTEWLVWRTNELQDLRLKNTFSDQRDSIFPLFDSTINILMGQDDFHTEPIDSTSFPYFYNCNKIRNDTNVTLAYTFINRITYCNSDDGRIRIYTWESLGGGCGHSYANHLVHRKQDGSVSIIDLTLEDHPDYDQHWQAYGYYDIKTFQFGNRTLYFLYGFGTTCGNSAYKNLRILEWQGDELTECMTCYPDSTGISVDASRSSYMHFDVDPKAGTIEYKQYVFDEGFYKRDEYEVIRLEYIDGRFVKAQKKR